MTSKLWQLLFTEQTMAESLADLPNDLLRAPVYAITDAARAAGTVARSFKRLSSRLTFTRPSVAPAQIAEPTPTPDETQEQQYREAVQRYESNCKIVQQSPLDDDEKEDRIREEMRVLAERIGQLMR